MSEAALWSIVVEMFNCRTHGSVCIEIPYRWEVSWNEAIRLSLLLRGCGQPQHGENSPTRWHSGNLWHSANSVPLSNVMECIGWSEDFFNLILNRCAKWPRKIVTDLCDGESVQKLTHHRDDAFGGWWTQNVIAFKISEAASRFDHFRVAFDSLMFRTMRIAPSLRSFATTSQVVFPRFRCSSFLINL
jgi:hypothetical protein